MKYLEAVAYLTEQNATKPNAEWDIKERKTKRSLDANSYFWVLVNEIAKKERLSDREVHDKILSENIAFYKNAEGGIDWKVSPEKPNRFGLLVEEVKDDYSYYLDSKMKVKLTKDDGKPVVDKEKHLVTGRVYWHIKGTHQMDSKEMQRVLDSTVFEAQQLGIETMTPDEIAHMKGFEDARKNKGLQDSQGR